MQWSTAWICRTAGEKGSEAEKIQAALAPQRVKTLGQPDRAP
jgi:hypothetical protein